MNKKGIELAIYGVVAFLLIILVLAGFWYFIVIPYQTLNGPAKESILAKEKIDLDLVLLNYLRTSIEIENKQYLISDLIRFYYLDNKYETQLREETNKTLGKLFSNYKLTFDKNIFLEENRDKYIATYGQKLNSENIVLLNNKNKLVIKLEAGVVNT
ncbi:MAG: hypothetical protein PHF86_09140 [Candidatus Nanoarchaeia archaeon]|nr:hypothetical protein [Candidatus Nanoarchaeia archaeon]